VTNFVAGVMISPMEKAISTTATKCTVSRQLPVAFVEHRNELETEQRLDARQHDACFLDSFLLYLLDSFVGRNTR
jgi:hypothetical protein